MNQSALAEALGMTRQAVSKLKRQGMPVHSVKAAQAWREKRQNLAARKSLPKAAAGARSAESEPPADDPTVYPVSDRDIARARREKAEANLAEMAEQKMRRELIRVDAVRTQLATEYAGFRDAMLQLPSRIGPVLAAESSAGAVVTMLEAEIHQLLTRLAGLGDSLENTPGGFS